MGQSLAAPVVSGSGSKPKGLRLVLLVYEELSRHAGENISSAELLQAAQHLIDLSKEEYVEINGRTAGPAPNYFSQDTWNALIQMPWRVASIENWLANGTWNDGELSGETALELRLLCAGFHERIWEF